MTDQSAPPASQTMAELRKQTGPKNESHLPAIAPGFGSLQSFELMQRAANLLSNSTLVPAAYRAKIEKLDKWGNVKESRDNPNALSNCVVALNMAQRMGADPLAVMQNLYIVEGRPAWSSQWIIAAVNGSGKFSPLRFDIKELGQKEVEYITSEWVNQERVTKTKKITIQDRECVAWAIEKETGVRITSPTVTIEMAVKEGWYSKNGSKWQTMPEVMLRYRTASFFGKLYAPEILMGIQTVEEIQDVIIDAQPDGKGNFTVDVESLRHTDKPPADNLKVVVEQAETAQPEQQGQDKPEPDKYAKERESIAACATMGALASVMNNMTAKAKAALKDELAAKSAALKVPQQQGEIVTYAEIAGKLKAAKTADAVDEAGSLIGEIADPKQRAELGELFVRAKEEFPF